jgi:hypothetical protein
MPLGLAAVGVARTPQDLPRWYTRRDGAVVGWPEFFPRRRFPYLPLKVQQIATQVLAVPDPMPLPKLLYRILDA